MQIKCLIPETNASFDTYRIGTVLELVRDITLALIAQGARVKVCVQGTSTAHRPWHPIIKSIALEYKQPAWKADRQGIAFKCPMHHRRHAASERCVCV
jgi:hypothetical protein